MTDRPAPPRSPRPAAKDDKAARQAAALRANLARRKAQKRARAPAAAPQEQG
jgi:hypothetical protein